ncbi:MAG: galactose ABC transporter substrate-binding protein [Synergistaceae bacterium]|nr:galactose ABC transporter substrate-binding protein [Synergistaceae bacterium]
MKKSSLILLAGFMALLTIFASGVAAAEKKPRLGVLIFDYSNAYVSYIRNSIEHSNADGKAELIMVDSQNDQAKQVEQVDNLIQQGVDALAINAVAPESAGAMIDKLKAAGIPVVFFNRCPSEKDLKSYDKCFYVGTTPAQSGEMQAKMAWEAFKANSAFDKNGDGKMQYVIIKGEPGHPDAEARTEANQYTLKNLNASVELLDIQTGRFRTAEAKDVMDAWVGKFGDKIEMVLTNSDAMTLGAVESLNGAKIKSGIVGINALPEVLPLIDNGTLIGSILSDAGREGVCIYTMSYNLATGKDVLTGLKEGFGSMNDVRIPYIPIDKSNTSLAREIYGKILK